MFGGETARLPFTNALWRLSAGKDGCFSWDKIQMQEKRKRPSPRSGHSGWEHGKKLWVFGGQGYLPFDYLNDNGNFKNVYLNSGLNNQLLYFDPFCQKWSNINCSGAVPSPRYNHSTAIIKDKVWLYGGKTSPGLCSTLFELNMESITWSKIETKMPKPECERWFRHFALTERSTCITQEHVTSLRM